MFILSTTFRNIRFCQSSWGSPEKIRVRGRQLQHCSLDSTDEVVMPVGEGPPGQNSQPTLTAAASCNHIFTFATTSQFADLLQDLLQRSFPVVRFKYEKFGCKTSRQQSHYRVQVFVLEPTR
eukprot:1469741-Amphidinium_carterae.1